jgi:hypothetical protein
MSFFGFVEVGVLLQEMTSNWEIEVDWEAGGDLLYNHFTVEPKRLRTLSGSHHPCDEVLTRLSTFREISQFRIEEYQIKQIVEQTGVFPALRRQISHNTNKGSLSVNI